MSAQEGGSKQVYTPAQLRGPLMRTRALLVAGLLILASWDAGPVIAQRSQPSGSVATPDLSGGWLLVDTSGSGSFDGTAASFPPPQLTDAGKAITERGDGRNLVPAGGGSAPAHGEGDAYIVNNGACTP